MEDFAAALRDLEAYLRLMPRDERRRERRERADGRRPTTTSRRLGIGADLGAREDAAPPRRRFQLTAGVRASCTRFACLPIRSGSRNPTP